MKQLPVIIPTLILIFMIVLLNVHIVRLDGEYRFLCKDRMTFVDTYIDMRTKNVGDYFSLPPKIRELLIRKKVLPEFSTGMKNEMRELFSVFGKK